MLRLVVAGVAVALACAAAYALSWSLAAPALPAVDLMLPLSAVALVVSLVAAAAALRALRHAARLRDDIHVLARSIDIALRDVVERNDRETATIGEVTAAVAREVSSLSERIAPGESAEAEPRPGNIIRHPSVRRGRDVSAAPEQAGAEPNSRSAELAWRDAIAAGAFDISLQPIVSVARSAATGFEVFASLPVEGGSRVDVRRPADPGILAETAVFERILVTTALQAGRRRLGAAGASMPLHVAVSDAILTDGKELGAILDTLHFYPDLAGTMVLSLPVASFDGRHDRTLEMLAGVGVRFACEGWNEATDAAGPISAGPSFLKIPANRLLDREPSRRKLAPAAIIIERAVGSGMTVIATEVASDDDAIGLIDLGLDLMCGPRFGGPRRLRPQSGPERPSGWRSADRALGPNS